MSAKAETEAEAEATYKVIHNGREVATGLDLESAVARRRAIKEEQPAALVTLMLDKNQEGVS